MRRKAKIIATIGPASQDEETLVKMVRAGMDVARLNFSHGDHSDHLQRIQTIRKVSAQLDKPITILQDLQGPKMRVGRLPGEGIELTAGATVTFTPSDQIDTQEPTDQSAIPLDVPQLAESVTRGNRILLDDGNLEMEVVRVEGQRVIARVVIGGTLKSNKGVNLPGADLKIPSLTEKDREDLAFGLSAGIDAVAISFVHTAKDIEQVRAFIRDTDPERVDTPIIAKLERPEAIQHLHEIIHAADGVMVARGDLAVETSPSAVPIMQKEIIAMANRHAKIVITATQMLESMIHNPRPTRAEASDVANAIFDGTDAVMLSAETAAGEYPVETISMMHSITLEAEKNIAAWGHSRDFPDELKEDDAITMTRAARTLAHDRNVTYITVFTQTGRTAQFMSKARPRVPILAFTPEERVYRRLGLMWGVIPQLVPFADSVESMLNHVDATLLKKNFVKSGQQVVIITGYPVGAFCLPNLAMLHTIP